MNRLSEYIWRSFEIIRGEIPASDYDVILFLLSAYKDGVIDFQEVIDPFGLPKKLKEDFEKDPKYFEILPEYFPIIERIYAPKLNELFANLGKIEGVQLSENFETIFEELLLQLSEYQKKGFGEIIQPKEVSRLIINLANLKEGFKVYNPFAGLGSYSLFLNSSHTYYGQELSKQTWALGKLRMLAHNKNFNKHYVQEDSVHHWNNRDKFDLIVSSPPLRMPIPREYRSIMTNEPYRRVESFLIDRAIHSLKDSGRLIALLPQIFLFSIGGSEKKLKESLISNDLIDSVISLPQGLFRNTGVSLCIVIFKKVANRPGYVKFVNGSNFIEKNMGKTRNNLLLDKDLIEVVDRDQENGILKYVPVEEIEAQNFDLSVSRYFTIKIQGEKIGSFSSILPGIKPNPDSQGKFVRIRDLKEDIVNNHLEVENIKDSPIPVGGVKKIQESCLLLATKWHTLKPTYFEFTGNSILIRPDILALKLDLSKVDVNYVISELHSDYVADQLKAVRAGTIIPSIRKQDLKNVKIQFPSPLSDPEAKKKQMEIVKVLKDSVQRAKLKEAGLLKELEEFKKRYEKELETKQHNIRQHLKNVNDSVNVLRHFMDLNNGVLRADDVINQKRNITVKRRFDALKESLDQVIFEINNITNELQFEPYIKLQLISTIKKCIDEYGSLQNFHIEFEPDEVALEEAKIKDPEINFSKSAFKEVFNNIVENARRHGFKESDKNYILEISLTIKDNYVILEFLNNGLPWPKGIVAKLGTKGVKAGASGNKGIGIWRVLETVKHYGGKYEIIDQPDETFPVGLKFKFELNTNSNEEV